MKVSADEVFRPMHYYQNSFWGPRLKKSRPCKLLV